MNERADALNADRLLAHAAWLRALARTLARGVDADDLAQETWRITLERWPASLDDSRLRGWLTTVARRLALRGRRDAAAHRAHEERWASESGEPLASDASDRVLLHKRIADAVHELDEPYRSAVELRYFDGLNARAIAARQGVSHDAARQRLSRALALLRARLDREYGGGRAQWVALVWTGLGDGASTAPWMTGGALMGGRLAVALVLVVGAAMWWWWGGRRAELAEHPNTAVAAVAPTATGSEDAPLATRESPSTADARTVVAPAATESFERVIDRDRDLHGVVIDSDRRPVVGARVLVVQYAFAELEFFELDPARRASSRARIAEHTTDAAGEFVVPLEAGRSYDVVVEAAGFASGGASHCHAGERVEITLSAGASLTGRVVRTLDGSPVARATVELQYERELNSQRTTDTVYAETDTDGRYRFDDLPPGKRLFGVFPIVDAPSGWIEVTLESGRTTEHDVRVEAGHRLRGRVVDRDTRAPIADALVGEGWLPRRSVRTDARGEFELPGSTLRGAYQVAVLARGYGRVDQQVQASDAGAAELVEISLVRGRTVRGRVVDRNGAPVENAYVVAPALEFEGFGSAQLHDWQATHSRADGTYEIEDVRRDMHHMLFVKKPGYGVVSYELDDGDSARDVLTLPDVVLHAGAIVQGVVVDEDGKQYGSRVVRLKGRNRDATLWNNRDRSTASLYVAERSTRSDDLGRFAFADVAVGDYELSAPLQNAQASVTRTVAVESAEPVTDVELVLPRGLSITGRVVGPDGAGVHAWLVLEAPDDPSGLVRQATDHDGTFVIRGLSERAYSGFAYPTQLASVADSVRLANAAIHDVPAGETDLVVHVVRAAPLSGRVLEADGAAAVGVMVEAFRNGAVDTSDLSAADGTFVLWVAENDGPYELRATGRTRQEGTLQRMVDFQSGSMPSVSGVIPGDGRQHELRLP